MQHREERISEHEGCSHLYEGGPEETEEDEEEEVMAAVCHSGDTYSAIQSIREDDEL